ncbi:MAG: hypothetical protein HDS43_01330 [Bacteroides sp.]|nr:hypothetical protein [Bacteroides sp.]
MDIINVVYNQSLYSYNSIYYEEQDFILNLPDILIQQYRNLTYYSKKILSDTIDGKSPLMYWNNSVATSGVNE